MGKPGRPTKMKKKPRTGLDCLGSSPPLTGGAWRPSGFLQHLDGYDYLVHTMVDVMDSVDFWPGWRLANWKISTLSPISLAYAQYFEAGTYLVTYSVEILYLLEDDSRLYGRSNLPTYLILYPERNVPRYKSDAVQLTGTV